MSDARRPRLKVRNATFQDIDAIIALSVRVYGEDHGYTPDMVRGHLAHFPEGQFVAVLDEEVVGYCATFRLSEAIAMAPHTWTEITAGGYASRHEPQGEWLYGMEVCVDPERRRIRIGQRLYDARKKLCQRLGLSGIVFGGRMPGYGRREKQFESAEAYARAVEAAAVRDPTLSFQLRNGFNLLGVLKGYLPTDRESRGYSAHLVWHNPKFGSDAVVRQQVRSGGVPETVRVAVIQYQQRRVVSFEQFCEYVEYFIDVVADYRSDFAVLPELLTLQLLSASPSTLSASESVDLLTTYTPRLRELLSGLAVRYNVNIVGGSHITRIEDGSVRNVCYVCLRDGSIHAREKIHPTPSERSFWGVVGGSEAEAVLTDCGPVGVMICYDSEFPELARHLVDQGALMLFVPFCTDERHGYCRVRYACHARAIENQCYVAMSGNVGNLPNVHNMDIQYAESCILTPCDFYFARDGVAADTTPNTEMVAFANLHLDDLIAARTSGTVLNLRDRRFDLYQTRWRGPRRSG
ncbi:MAG TPA: GNAT family N-acetyltransferase [Xanthomonadaceae bacterium]|nr:GNAT family N-acetyltransferase [Xanthomonadaceae bacterium]